MVRLCHGDTRDHSGFRKTSAPGRVCGNVLTYSAGASGDRYMKLGVYPLYGFLLLALLGWQEETTGELRGTWRYIGSDLQDEETGLVRSVVIGDHTWWIHRRLEFKPDAVNSVPPGTERWPQMMQWCHYRSVGPAILRIDCGHGSKEVPFILKDNVLILDLSRGDTRMVRGGSLRISFERDGSEEPS